jgi:hypothetical protein
MFKKLAFFILLNLLITNSSFAYDVDDMPEIDYSDLNGNIKDHGFRIIGTNAVIAFGKFPVEIITLEKKGWILKCRVKYTTDVLTFCYYP